MFRPLLLEHFRMMVRLGLARSRVQPYPRNKSGCELRATSYEQTGGLGLLEARGSKLEADLDRSFGSFGE
jgi:hypothetical protein